MILTATHICKQFGSQVVLDNLDFEVDRSEVCAITGRNGAGKTTLVRIVAGLLEPDSGTVSIGGATSPRMARHLIGYLPEERGLYRNMEAGEQVVYIARLRGMGGREAEASARQWFERLGIESHWRSMANRMSKGMQQRVQFAAAVAHNPMLLVLDEPFSGFDRDGADMLLDQLQQLKRQGMAILLSTHNREAVEQLATKEVKL